MRRCVRSVVVALGGWVVAVAPGDARAQEAPRVASYCAAETAESRAAQASVRALGAAIADPEASLEALAQRYEALLGTPCLESVGAGEPPLHSRAALRAWWADGGLDWLWHFARGRSGGELEVVLPPTARPVLSLESTPPDHPLRALLCREADDACGRQTAGWRLRAEEAFAAHAARERARELRLAEEAEPGSAEASNGTQEGRVRACAHEVAALPPAERFPRWRACVSAARDVTSVLPVSYLRAPTRGWLVVRGRRGHYEFCDEIRAYDLASGAAYLSSRCGRILGAAPSAGESVVVGRVPLDALREAAWMALLAASVSSEHRASLRVPVPANVPLRWNADAIGAVGRGGGWASSAQTRLAWAWVEGSRVLASGHLTWPESDRAAETHAASLLRVAEAALEPGCTPAPLPRAMALGIDSLGVSSVDVDSATLETIGRELEVALRAARAPRCRR